MSDPTSPSGFYPPNLNEQVGVQSYCSEQPLQLLPARIDRSASQAAASSTTGVHAAVTDTGSAQSIATGFTNPPCARSITATAAGTAADVKAIQVTVYGTDIDGQDIQETLPAFTADSATNNTVEGSKAFATVTGWDLPAHDGTGATTSLGWGNKLGLPFKLSRNTIFLAFLNDSKEGTLPTVAVSSSVLASNTAKLNTALNGTAVKLYLLVP